MQIENLDIPKPVFFDHDGSFDDLISLIFLLTFNNIKLSGISITNACADIEISTENTLRILNLFNRDDVQIAKSSVEGINQFPDLWRKNTAEISLFPRLKKVTPNFNLLSRLEGSDFLAETILREQEKTTVLLTCPATNLMNAIEKYPELIDKIDRVVWMAGAFLSNGNVNAPDHDGSAEWNIFWDPISAQKLIKQGLKIYMFPIDVCQMVSIDNYFLQHLHNKKNSKLCQLVHAILNLNKELQHTRIFLYDVICTSFLIHHELFRFSSISADIETRGTSLGNIYRTSKGGPIKYANWIDDELFMKVFIDQLKRI
jgi:purine nucleosidase